jgi:prolyl oligopeptidase
VPTATSRPGHLAVRAATGCVGQRHHRPPGFDLYGDEIFLHRTGFDKPPQLLHGASAAPVGEIKSSPAFFDADDLVVSQRFTTSADGARVPYFPVSHRDSTDPAPHCWTATVPRVAQLPSYLGALGRLWLARGGSYALANIRGGGEYGPAWHEQAVRAGRHKVAEDSPLPHRIWWLRAAQVCNRSAMWLRMRCITTDLGCLYIWFHLP